MSLKLYLVSCDLLHDGDYASFKSRLSTFEAHQVLERQWALHSTHTAAVRTFSTVPIIVMKKNAVMP